MAHTTIQSSEFQHVYQVVASDLNQYGMMHGGRLLTLCDETGYVSACKHARCDCLTRAVHQVQFYRPILQGDHLCIRARVGLVGHSSLWTVVEVVCGGQRMMDGVFVFAAIDEQRNIIRKVSAIRAESKEEELLQIRLRSMRSQLV
ncbi:MAG: acyl-CoA thioesterase [Mariprofundus sp.]